MLQNKSPQILPHSIAETLSLVRIMQVMYWRSCRTNQLSAGLKKNPPKLSTCTARGISGCTLLWWSGLHLQLQVFINTELSWITGHVGSDNICFYTHLLWGNLDWQNSYWYEWMRSHRCTQRGMWIYPLPHTSPWFHTTLVWDPEFGLIAQLALYTCNTKRRRKKKDPCTDVLQSPVLGYKFQPCFCSTHRNICLMTLQWCD